MPLPLRTSFFGKALFALKPVNVSENELTVQSFWLSATKATNTVFLTERPTPSVSDVGPGRRVKLYDMVTDRVIQFGDLITMSTDDPTGRSLPDWQILEMQWHLQRVAAMSGAGQTSQGASKEDEGNRDGAAENILAEFDAIALADDSDSDANWSGAVDSLWSSDEDDTADTINLRLHNSSKSRAPWSSSYMFSRPLISSNQGPGPGQVAVFGPLAPSGTTCKVSPVWMITLSPFMIVLFASSSVARQTTI